MELYEIPLVYSDPVNDNLVCSICCQPFIEPVTSPCKHYFCRQCIEKALDIKGECPIDRLSLSLLDVVIAPTIITNMVNELKVECPYSDKGCEYTSQRHLLVGHLQECPFKDSTTTEEASNSENKELKNCPHCHKKNLDLVSHIIDCEEMQITCRCNRFGCSWAGARKLLNDHSKDCNYLKLESFLEKQDSRIIALEKENTELRSLVQSFHKDLEALNEKVTEKDSQTQSNTGESSSSQNRPTTQRFFNDLPAASLERVRADHQRLRFELMSLSSSLGSLELKQNIALTTECLGLRDEIYDLRCSIQTIKVDLDDMARERQTTLSALAALAKNASSRVQRSASISGHSKSAL